MGHKSPVTIQNVKPGDYVTCFLLNGPVYANAKVYGSTPDNFYIKYEDEKILLQVFQSIIIQLHGNSNDKN